MLPKELETILGEHGDQLNLHITKVDYSTPEFIFEFSLDTQDYYEAEPIHQQWRVIASGSTKNNLSFDWEYELSITDDHALLWEFTDIQCNLYYSGECKDVPKLFYDLYQEHAYLFNELQAFSIHFEKSSSSSVPFYYKNGLLASGPKKLMLVYADCLKRNGMDYSIIGERAASSWEGEKYLEYSNNLKLLLFGKSYIIAEAFVFEKIEEPI